MSDPSLKAALTLQREGDPRIGGDRIRLLRAIDANGSIAGAAREMGLSYKAAWDAVGSMNNLFARPLVEAAPGGRTGGGARVTRAGHALIACFSMLEASLGKALAAIDTGLKTSPGGAVNTLWSLMMQTSTRNTFRCTVTRITPGAVSTEVDMALTDGHTLTAVITERSAADMGLAEGSEVFALIKATFVMLAAGEAPANISACNRLTGTVSAREDGPVNSEVTLDLGEGKTITAIITRTSADALDLAVGSTATALFKASHVIVAMP
ncbi:TOBE domain-containing protein [Rhodovulum visakhapatnamense]|uniref:ModE family transcriptional regulator n=1 Tax=Rhodovulum visakhapatnamense TaxID=364297 RepID=A0A4R8FQ41_9RHOB|nr:TOBE domain-containing protein [Rhodovulum visakhapatnamense]TDX28573.1 ModE family transcriptional regulator [Rhodovulum visakhapatnamense]